MRLCSDIHLSVIIPTADRPRLLAKLLDALGCQAIEHRFEIIVVDDSGRTNLEHLRFQTALCTCTILRGEGKGPARARNLGAWHALGAYLVFLDDDSIVDPSYLARISKCLAQHPGHAFAGPQRSIDRENSFALAAEWLADRFVDAERLESRRFTFAASNGFAVERSEFWRVGGFHPGFPLAACEDREFCTRWIAAGCHIEFLEELAIQHHFPATLASFSRQQWRYGRGAVLYSALVSPEKRPRVRSAGFYGSLVLGPFRHYGALRGVRVSLLAALSQAIVWGGYMYETRSPARTQVSEPSRAAREQAK
jgi:GT2 family glycosyltransferase